jgi:hypothetical protein
VRSGREASIVAWARGPNLGADQEDSDTAVQREPADPSAEPARAPNRVPDAASGHASTIHGCASLSGRLFEALDGELHAMARARITRNAPINMLDATSLLNDLYLRLVQLSMSNRVHLLTNASDAE